MNKFARQSMNKFGKVLSKCMLDLKVASETLPSLVEALFQALARVMEQPLLLHVDKHLGKNVRMCHNNSAQMFQDKIASLLVPNQRCSSIPKLVRSSVSDKQCRYVLKQVHWQRSNNVPRQRWKNIPD